MVKRGEKIAGADYGSVVWIAGLSAVAVWQGGEAPATPAGRAYGASASAPRSPSPPTPATFRYYQISADIAKIQNALASDAPPPPLATHPHPQNQKNGAVCRLCPDDLSLTRRLLY